MATSNAQRAGIISLAVLFLLTTVGFTAYVIWQVNQENDTASISEQIAEATNQNELEQPTTNPEGEALLQGTQLQNFEPQAEAETLQTIDLTDGDGAAVADSSASVRVHYTGAYAVNGEIFESSYDSGEPVEFPLTGVIPGWTEGVPGMKVGGTRRLIIPGDLAYGLAPEGYVPGSTDRPQGTLVFDITLLEIL